MNMNMPLWEPARQAEKLLDELDLALEKVGRVRSGRVDTLSDPGRHATEDSQGINQLDAEVVRLCREICEIAPNQTPLNLLGVALRSLQRRGKIEEHIGALIRYDLEKQLSVKHS